MCFRHFSFKEEKGSAFCRLFFLFTTDSLIFVDIKGKLCNTKDVIKLLFLLKFVYYVEFFVRLFRHLFFIRCT